MIIRKIFFIDKVYKCKYYAVYTRKQIMKALHRIKTGGKIMTKKSQIVVLIFLSLFLSSGIFAINLRDIGRYKQLEGR